MQNGRHVAEDTFREWRFLISITISLKVLPKGIYQYSSIVSDDGLASTR